jgi:uncharacterized protein DUF5666
VSRFTSTLAGAAAAALVLAAPAATAFASRPADGQTSTHANQSKSHFTANGKVTAVDATSFTMHVKGGSKDLHGTDVAVTVTDTTKMRRDGAKATVADLQVGDRVNSHGTRGADGTLTARHVNAHGPAADGSTGDTSGTDTSGTDTSGTDTSGTDTSGTDTSGTDTSGTGTGA